MFNFTKKKNISCQFPVIQFENFITNKLCTLISREIVNFNNFDDKVMSARNRINKGSKNFKNFLKSSPNSNSLYKKINTLKLFKKIFKQLSINSNINWYVENNPEYFSKTNFGVQKTTISSFLKSFFTNFFYKPILNLDIDFSLSEYGYNRSPHRDRDTRILSFLIYFNSIDKKYGGAFEIYDLKNKFYQSRKKLIFPQSPKKKSLNLLKSINPKKGKMIAFLSTPNSYHAAARFLSKEKRRIFMYASFSLNKKVRWKYLN